ncbi:hypothetical protein COO60DRAFT_1186078 [Scenedesmus sp. NREL 46B-D3]|nr:hypothetical protein COO60DRAFT_1186078 [Scenedesmus sp. NREL 46B-D3]
MQLVSSCARVLQPARCLAALSCGPPAVWAPHLNTPASIATTSDGQNSQSQEGSAVSSSTERGSTQQATGTSRGAVPSAAISPDQDLEQPTAAEAAREEEQFGLNTPAPGKGDNNSSDSSSSSSSSQ